MVEIPNQQCPWVTVERSTNLPRWHLTKLGYRDANASGGNHNIYYTVLDENGVVVSGVQCWQGWPDGQTFEIAQAGQANIGIWGGPFYPDRGESGAYFAWIARQNESDLVQGIGLPVNFHVCYDLEFRRVVKDTEPPPPPPPGSEPSGDTLTRARLARALEAMAAELRKDA